MHQLKDKKILLGITGSIAAYKACELIRQLKDSGSDVAVMMTSNALEFVTPLTLKTLSENPVLKNLYDESEFEGIYHINVSHWADLVLICPATANSIGKMAAGLADDVISTVVLSTKASILIAPAMNDQMYENKIFRRNLKLLQETGIYVVEPDSGYLACGYHGIGRLASTEKILASANKILSS